MAKYEYKGFESATDEMRYTFHNCSESTSHPVATLEQGIALVKQALINGDMSRVIIEQGYYVKCAYALDYDGHFLYNFSLIWKQVN